MLEAGELVHVQVRRRFDEDLRRHFFGSVELTSEFSVRLKGRVFVWDGASNRFVKLARQRTWILPLGDSGLIFNVLPPEADQEAASYKKTADGRLVFTDGVSFELDIHEFGPTR